MLGCVGIVTAAGFCYGDARLFRKAECVRRQRDVRATAKGVRWHAYLGHAHTRLPLSVSLASATWAHFCISRNRPRAVANRRRREGRRQPTSVTAPGGPAAGAQLLQGRRAAGGPRESAHCPGRGAQCDTGWPGRAVAAELQPAKRAAGGPKPTPGRRCGPGAACKPVASDWRWATARTSPPLADGSYRSTNCAAKHDNCAGALASRSRGKLWPRLRSTNAPWGFLRVRL